MPLLKFMSLTFYLSCHFLRGDFNGEKCWVPYSAGSSSFCCQEEMRLIHINLSKDTCYSVNTMIDSSYIHSWRCPHVSQILRCFHKQLKLSVPGHNYIHTVFTRTQFLHWFPLCFHKCRFLVETLDYDELLVKRCLCGSTLLHPL